MAEGVGRKGGIDKRMVRDKEKRRVRSKVSVLLILKLGFFAKILSVNPISSNDDNKE